MALRRRSVSSEERKLWRLVMRDAKPLRLKPPLAPNASLDRRTDDRLCRGRLSIQARLDLHGMTQAEAHSALDGFVRRSQATGRRAILIITGKGAVSAGGGVLRRAVPRWLHEPPLRELVLAIREAQPKDGGEGALYVLLRKPKPRA